MSHFKMKIIISDMESNFQFFTNFRKIIVFNVYYKYTYIQIVQKVPN